MSVWENAVFTEDQKSSLARSLRNGDYNLLLGAAASLGTKNHAGTDLPLADQYRSYICDVTGANPRTSLSRAYGLLDPAGVEQHVTDFFRAARPGETLQLLPEFIWRRIFTLNVDDALESAYTAATRYQTPHVLNFTDPYEEYREKSDVPIIHIHGWVQRPDDGYVFSREEYQGLIKKSNPWVVTLAQFITTEPFIIIGSSLEENDIDYFLSNRTPTSARADRGPSIWIEPNDGPEIVRECERRGLVHFKGTALDFVRYLSSEIKERPRPESFTSDDEKRLFAVQFSTKQIASFFSDFELVPSEPVTGPDRTSFLLGKQPTWVDLTNDLDVPRGAVTKAIEHVSDFLIGSDPARLIYLDDSAGTGKTTILRRVAFDLARQGVNVLYASSDGRVDPPVVAEMLNATAGRTCVVVDNFADHVTVYQQVLQLLTQQNVAFIVSDRPYRFRYVKEVLGSTKMRRITADRLTESQCTSLVRNYTVAGLSSTAITDRSPREIFSLLKSEPIAIACCRIMNQFRPLDRIVDSLFADSTSIERKRYLAAAIAEDCSKVGIRYEILAAVGGSARMNEQFNSRATLPLTHTNSRDGSYILPLNSVLGARFSNQCVTRDPKMVFDVYVAIARAIAPRVSRRAIIKRQAEARLAGRLFDYDQMVEKYLGDRSEEFFEAVQDDWRWNSRYWEQLALINLKSFFRSQERGDPEYELLESALGHARHAVSIEEHPLTLTTLAKILFHSSAASSNGASDFDEALGCAYRAIEIEKSRRARVSVHPYVVILQGLKGLDHTTSLRDSQVELIGRILRDASKRFKHDDEVRALIRDIEELEIV